ncbi:lymphocyte antigen 6G-like [Notolabrus celidotus]|uniref:lymphocyte antigen 6G-like n=1 Tax=Notolabrus celidotus TaxID=1203425 RepID=UPI00148F968C|nr:lymphocyte antigen 6G-like [Notolabrus celidotus]
MKPYGALILCMTLSTAYGIKCFSCAAANPSTCTNTIDCTILLDRCFSHELGPLVTKGCMSSIACIGDMSCCKGDLCNSAVPIGPSALLLLVSSAVITHFL